ncbi:signal peptidase I [Herbiconiux solani]|uniref:signal peptidase I n=1 Tax=Herbiconiux solani TaxID=661329 RepID=UPI0008244D21|nr:signal peptidase I [Herbiconiux solani]
MTGRRTAGPGGSPLGTAARRAGRGGTPLGTAARWAGRVAAWALLLTAAALLVTMVALPRLAGATAYTILTGSMEPGLPPGELVVVRPVDPASVTVGQVVTYQLESGKPAVVTHRVVSVAVTGAGERVFTLQGDANPASDPDSVRAEQLRGALWYHVPLAGYLNLWLTGEWRGPVTAAVAGLLLTYAALMWLKAARSQIARRKGVPDAVHDDAEVASAPENGRDADVRPLLFRSDDGGRHPLGRGR